MGRLFGTDGARGVAITELTCEMAMNIGRAAASVLTKHKNNGERAKILIGKDTRISSDVLEAALVAGITSVGVDVELLGIVPTPAVAHLVRTHNADSGVMISASHNSVEYNGIKLFAGTGFKLPDSIENEIEELILDNPDKICLKDGCEIGRVTYLSNAVDEYISHLKETSTKSYDGITVGVDCANGSASATAKKLFNSLNVNALFINDSPDGCNINKDCGSTHIEELQKFVVDNKCDLGVAFDGDADRCLAVDEKGNIVDGDKLIAIISSHMKNCGTLKNNTAVVTVMSNLGFHTYMKNNNINTVCTAVGDRYVLEEMLKSGYNIGGEQSGHIIFLDYATTGDGQLTAVQLLNLIAASGKTLSELVSDIPDYPQLLMNVKITDEQKGKWNKTPSILAVIEEAEEKLGENGRVLVRESGTEPLVRVMIEGKNADDVKCWTEKIVDIVKKELC